MRLLPGRPALRGRFGFSLRPLQRPIRQALSGLLLALASGLALAQVNGFYRFPSLHGDTVWFTAEGDLWRVAASGGAAQRITTHPAFETRPSVSPDGRWLAFTGAYEGPTEAYVMAIDGGVPKRLTWAGQSVLVVGWTPAGEVLVTAPAADGAPDTQLYAIDPATLARRTLPVGAASDGALSADGKTLYFVRAGLRGDNVRAYRGGAMARLWAITLGANQATSLSANPATALGANPVTSLGASPATAPGANPATGPEARPLVAADANARRPMPYVTAAGEARVAYLSDRDGAFNLWSVDAQGANPRQHTHHSAWDIRAAAIDGTRVVYTLGADLHLIDLATDADRLLDITLGGDFDQLRTRWIKSPQPYLTAAHLAPNGERVVLTARGRVATQGVAALRRAELAVPAGTRCREAVFSRDSTEVFALCDSSGEVEAWRFKANGSGTPVQITHGANLLRLAAFPSPDGKWLAHFDLSGQLTLTALTPAGGGASKVIDRPRIAGEPALAWSPDSQAIAFARTSGSTYNRARLTLYTLADATLRPLTSDRYDSAAPAFTPDGKWLYFISERSFTPLKPGPWGDRNMGAYFDRRAKVYALALQPGLRFPFQPHDELEPSTPRPEPGPTTTITTVVGAPAGAASASVTVQTRPAPPPVKPAGALPAIVTDGLAQRLFEVPLAAGNYGALGTDGKRLYLHEFETTPERRGSLKSLAIENTGPQPELFAPDVKDFELTPDGKKLMLVRSGRGNDTGDILIVDTGAKLPTDTAKNRVNWTDWQIAIEPRAEWRQTFDDAWRMHRDYFHDAKMLGVDWPALRRQYEPLLARLTDRAELVELLAQMVSPLHTLHSQVYSPDLRSGPDAIGPAGLGARFTKVAGGFRVDQVYRSDPELPSEAAPLAQAGVARGAVITAVNGRPTRDVADLSELLRGQAGRQLLLTLQADAAAKPREVVVTPVDAGREGQLAVGDWEAGRAERVQTRGNGRIGYLRLRAMTGADIATFAREFYANVDRDGLIIDVRGNRGGNIDSWVLEKLLRRTWAFWQPGPSSGKAPFSNMQETFRGHLAVLIDGYTYSDGETFAEGVRRLQLGTLIGQRTAGAGIWLNDRNRLVDNGMMRVAENAQFALDGRWLIEGSGVAPDIEVDNPPRATFAGGDAQLDAAIAHLQRRLAEQPITVPVAPAR